MLYQQAKKIVRRAAPALYQTWRMRIGHPARYDRISRVIYAACGGLVMSGPFAGMACGRAVSGSMVPKLLGSYECELHPVVERIVSTPHPVILNVGSGEGYYAVGLARRMPNAQVYAFDTDPAAREQCAGQAELNGVASRVHVEGFCDPQRLGGMPLDGALLVCDCEGYEVELLSPAEAPGLAVCDILVELHDGLRAGATETILPRFAATHTIELIDAVGRGSSQYPTLKELYPWDRRLALSEARYGPMQWAYMTARRSAVRPGHDADGART